MRSGSHIVLLLLTLFAVRPALGQAIFVTPSQTEFDQIDLLTGKPRSKRLSLEARTLFHFDTNVEDFARAGIKHPAPTKVGGSDGYYTSDQTQEMGIAKGFWQFTVAMDQAELYRGNHDAVQLYLDSVSRSISTTGVYNPVMTLNRSKSTRWRLDYASPIPLGKTEAQIQLTGSFLRFSRVQSGHLTGNTTNGQFHGDITLDTTLGLPSDQVDSYGVTLDAGISVKVRPRLRLSASVENLLGQAWQSHVQHIVTMVTTNTLVPNGDGFLQGVPLLSGQVTNLSSGSALRKRYHLGTAYTESGRDWLALLSYDFDWRVNLGANLRFSHGRRAWILLCPTPAEWQVGYEQGGFRFQFGLSALDLGTSQRATIQIGYRLYL